MDSVDPNRTPSNGPDESRYPAWLLLLVTSVSHPVAATVAYVCAEECNAVRFRKWLSGPSPIVETVGFQLIVLMLVVNLVGVALVAFRFKRVGIFISTLSAIVSGVLFYWFCKLSNIG